MIKPIPVNRNLLDAQTKSVPSLRGALPQSPLEVDIPLTSLT